MILDWNSAIEQCWRCSMMMAVVIISAGVGRRMLLTRQALLQLGLIGLVVLPLTMWCPKLEWRILPALRPQITASEIAFSVDQPPLPLNAVARDDFIPAASHQGLKSRDQVPLANDVSLIPASLPNAPLSIDSIQQPESGSPVAHEIDLNSETVADTAPLLTGADSNSYLPVPFWSIFYVTGVLVMCGRLAVGLWKIRLLHRDAAACHDASWLKALQHCRQQLNIQRPIRLCSTTTITSPLAFGWLRPVLIVPVLLLDESSPSERNVILLHELTHIQRHDFAWTILLHVVQALYWFHPLMWWLGREFSATQEEVCDGICVAEFGARSYSETLVSVVRLVRRPSVLTLGLAMSRSGRLSQRLTRIQRHGGLSMSRLSVPSWCVVLALAIPLGFALMFLEPARAEQAESKSVAASNDVPNTDKSDASSSEVKPTPVTEVTPHVVLLIQKSEDKSPLASTAVKVRRVFDEGRFPTFSPETREFVSDASGVVNIPFKDLGPEVKEVLLEITAKDYATEGEAFTVRRTTEQASPKVLSLWPGLKLATHVFDAEGRPITDARVRIMAEVTEKGFSTWLYHGRGDATGLIEFQVPRDKVFGLIVGSDRGAPYRIVYPEGTRELSEIHLRRGCTVAGQLLDRNGRPVPDCTVNLEAEDSEAVDSEYQVGRQGGSLGLQLERKTDAEGRFRFSPMVGPVRVSLDCSKSGETPRIIIPISLDLPESGEKWLPLMLAPTGRITGKALWPDGKPVQKLHFEVVAPPNLSNAFITLSSAHTDAQGNYSLDIPFPLEDADITGSSVKGPDGKYWNSRPLNAPPARYENPWYPLRRYLGETLTADWGMTSPEEKPGKSVAAPVTVEPEWQALAKLEREIEAAIQAYAAAPAGDAQEKLDPRVTMVKRCLEFEAENRGTRSAIGALHYVMRAAATTTYGVPSEARTAAIAVLDQHYLRHPDVDLLIDEFGSGSGIATGENLLRHVAEQSPFDYVRAAALFHLAELQLDTLSAAENIDRIPLQSEAEFDAQLKIQDSDSIRTWLRDRRAEELERRAELKRIDPVQLRSSGLELLDRIVNNYSAIKAPPRQWENTLGREGHDSNLKLIDSRETWRSPTIPQRAEILRFQRTRLLRDMPAPEIEGFDFHQRPIRLSQFKGQVVLLVMGVRNSGDELCAKCSDVVTALRGQPFQCISIVSGSGGYTVGSIVKDNKITWPIIRDTADDSIANRWCQFTSPELYLIDQRGVISVHLGGDYIATRDLIKIIQAVLKPKE